MRPEQLCAAIERLPEDRLGLVQLPPHPRVLGPLAGEEEGDLGARGTDGRPCQDPGSPFPCGDRREGGLRCADAVSATTRQAVREVGAAGVRGVADVGKTTLGVGREVLRIPARQ